ncbi:ATPase [Mycobacterium tuberculosis]|nr:ATPase [Mycobacterium tuberculosis]
MVRLVTFGLVGLGRSGMQRQEAQFEATIRTVLHGNHKVAVLGKGGVGKTSVAACVGSILAELRQQDRIVGIDADTAFGRLSSRIDPRAAGSFWELTTDTNLRSFTDITARLGRNSAGLYVLAGQPASGPRRVLDPAIYREAALRLDHHFAISVIDCGSSMEAAVTQEVLRDVDALIVVSSPWADGASAAANTIEWLSDYGLTGLLRRSIVVLNDSDGHADKRTKSLLAQEFIDHGQPVVEVPFDPHLRPGGVIDMSHEMAPTTRLKILQVAATVTAYFASRPADAHGSPPRGPGWLTRSATAGSPERRPAKRQSRRPSSNPGGRNAARNVDSARNLVDFLALSTSRASHRHCSADPSNQRSRRRLRHADWADTRWSRTG